MDRTRDIENELAPVFAALDGAQRRARELVADAERDAALLRATTGDESERILSAARADAGTVRADAAVTRLADARRAHERLLAAGREEAERIGRVAEERMPAVVGAVLERVLASLRPPPGLAEGTGVGPEPGGGETGPHEGRAR